MADKSDIVEGEKSPFSMTNGEYEKFLIKQPEFSNDRKEGDSLFKAMKDDLPRFKDSQEGKLLIDMLSGDELFKRKTDGKQN